MIAPSGAQIEIAAGDQQAVVVEIGGGLRGYSAGGLELVDGYGADEMSSSGRGQVLIPWPNRLQDGSYEFNGQHHQLPLNEPECCNAIQGLVRWTVWTTSCIRNRVIPSRSGFASNMRCRMAGCGCIRRPQTSGGTRVPTDAVLIRT